MTEDNVVAMPARVEIRVDDIPRELKELGRRWVVWSWRKRDSRNGPKWTKPPRRASDGRDASATDPEDWATFSEAVNAVTASGGKYSGVGVTAVAEDDLVFWDFDHCLDPRDPTHVAPWARAVVERLASYTEITPSGTGLHVIVRGHVPVAGKKAGRPGGGGIECYSAARYVTVTGLRHPISPYGDIREVPDLDVIWDREFSPVPAADLREIRRSERTAALFDGRWQEIEPSWSQSEADLALCSALAEIAGGDRLRVDRLFRASRLLRAKWDEARGDETYGERTIRTALEGFRARGPVISPSDTGNALRFVDRFGDETRFVAGDWYVWDGVRVRRDDLDVVKTYADAVVDNINVEARGSTSDRRREALARAVARLESRSGVESMLSLAAARPPIPARAADLNRDPMLINFANGTYDARSGTLREARFDDLITRVAGASLRPGAPAPRWRRFLEEILPDPDVRDYVQRAIGYSATGDLREQTIFFCHGSGANGKSKFFNAVRLALGDYFTTLPSSALIETRTEQHPTVLFDLWGARLALSSEIRDGRRFDEEVLKYVTGESVIKARRMHHDFVEFPVTAKIWIMGNHKPAIRGTDYAVWRRVRLIPFEQTFRGADADPELDAKLAAEVEGIAAWIIEGTAAWLARGLESPAAVAAATEEYREEQDVLAAWLAERTTTGAVGARVPLADLYSDYDAWCAANGEHPVTSRGFATKLREKNFPVERGAAGRRIVVGVRLVERQTAGM